MAREKYKIGSRASRFGPKRSSRTGKGRARSVVPLNQGSSPHKQSTTMTPGSARGGAFGSGRASGGAAPSVLSALMGPSVEGAPVIGPPPVEPTDLPPDVQTRAPGFPEFRPPVLNPTHPVTVAPRPDPFNPSPHPFQNPLLPTFRPPPVDPFPPLRGRNRAV